MMMKLHSRISAILDVSYGQEGFSGYEFLKAKTFGMYPIDQVYVIQE